MWASTIINAPKATRTKLKAAILEGMEFYNAKFKVIGEKDLKAGGGLEDQLEGNIEYKVTSKDADIMAFIKKLRAEKDFEFIGFSDQVTYIKENGTGEQLNALWEHPWGSPMLMYKIKGLPALIIAGPDIEFNDSIRNGIKSNKNTRVKTYGVTG